MNYFVDHSSIAQAEFMNSETKGNEHYQHQTWSSFSTTLSNAQEAMGFASPTRSYPKRFDPLPLESTDLTPIPLNFVSMNQPTSFVISEKECKLLDDFVEKLTRENGNRASADGQRTPSSICDCCIVNAYQHASSDDNPVKRQSLQVTALGNRDQNDLKNASFPYCSKPYFGETLTDTTTSMKMSSRVGFPPSTLSSEMTSTFETPLLDEDASDAAKPLKALSAYNFFFRYKRECLLSGNDSDDDDVYSTNMQTLLLHSHWYRDRSQKRRHRKSHGKIDFATLSRTVSQRWKKLPEDRKNFFKEVARLDLQRYRRQQKQLEYSRPVTAETYLYPFRVDLKTK